ncbi:MAG TPA: phosphatase PAP2 family protein [Burkholderiales bacterium]|nr:phosphatase PAP2 family protein [Burkholderiales bacterium]
MSAPRLWLVPALAALGLAALLASGTDRSLFLSLNGIGPATSDWAWANVTVLGDTLVGFTLCLPLWRRRPDLVWAFALAALLGTAWARGLKPLVDEARPPAVLDGLVHLIGPARSSEGFPSGHPTTAFAIAGLYALGLRSRALAGAALALALLVALSRVVVGVHWPVDVLGGALGGWLAAAGGIALARRTPRVGRHAATQACIGAFLVVCALLLVAGVPHREYADAVYLERAIGLACLAAAAGALWRDARLGHAGLGGRADL